MNVKVGDERSACVIPTMIYQTIQIDDDSLKTMHSHNYRDSFKHSLVNLKGKGGRCRVVRINRLDQKSFVKLMH